jgi:organic radical activating enzyme
MNNQLPEREINKHTLEVNSIFDTIQGEGPYAGWPATFIRLAGCNLQCVWCDTEYTTRHDMFSEDIIGLVNHELVVITGGEPFRQNIALLVQLLKDLNHIVQIETNGTIFNQEVIDIGCTVVISPKTKKIDNRFLSCDNTNSKIYTKYLFGGAFPSQPDNKGGMPLIPTEDIDYIMPLDTGDPIKNAKINQDAVNFCLKHNIKLTIQQHKILNIP